MKAGKSKKTPKKEMSPSENSSTRHLEDSQSSGSLEESEDSVDGFDPTFEDLYEIDEDSYLGEVSSQLNADQISGLFVGGQNLYLENKAAAQVEYSTHRIDRKEDSQFGGDCKEC